MPPCSLLFHFALVFWQRDGAFGGLALAVSQLIIQFFW